MRERSWAASCQCFLTQPLSQTASTQGVRRLPLEHKDAHRCAELIGDLDPSFGCKPEPGAGILQHLAKERHRGGAGLLGSDQNATLLVCLGVAFAICVERVSWRGRLVAWNGMRRSA